MNRPPFWATVFALAGIALLCGLGTWQIQRLHWKEDMLARIEAQKKDFRHFAPVDMTPENEYAQGEIEGRLLYDKEIALAPRTREGQPGYHIITPLRLTDGHILLVNRGWAPLDYKAGTPTHGEGPVSVAGMIRDVPKPNWFTPENNPEKNQWYRIDPAQIAAAKGFETPVPIVLYEIDLTDGEGGGRSFPDPALALDIPNNHRQYAVFWFGMAGLLALFYALRFLRKKD